MFYHSIQETSRARNPQCCGRWAAPGEAPLTEAAPEEEGADAQPGRAAATRSPPPAPALLPIPVQSLSPSSLKAGAVPAAMPAPSRAGGIEANSL